MADQNLSSFLWSVADLLRGDYKRSDFGKVILPFTVLRRLNCVLEATKGAAKEKSAPRLRWLLQRAIKKPRALRASENAHLQQAPLGPRHANVASEQPLAQQNGDRPRGRSVSARRSPVLERACPTLRRRWTRQVIVSAAAMSSPGVLA